MTDNNRMFVPRWGDASLDDTDYVIIPGLILRNCAAAGVEPEQLAFIAQVMSFKYDTPNSAARPSVASIAKRLGVSSDTARRYKNSLIDKGLMEFEPQCDEKGYSIAPDILTFAGLVRKCRELDTPSCNSAIPPLAELPYEELEDKNKESNPTAKTSKHEVLAGAPTPGADEPAADPVTIQPHVDIIDHYFKALTEVNRAPIMDTDKKYARYGAAGSTMAKAHVDPVDVYYATLAVFRDDFPDDFYRTRSKPIALDELLSIWGIAHEWGDKLKPRPPIVVDFGPHVEVNVDELLRAAEMGARERGLIE